MTEAITISTFNATTPVPPCQFCGAAGERTQIRHEAKLRDCLSWECGSLLIDGEALMQCVNKCRIRQLENEIKRLNSGDRTTLEAEIVRLKAGDFTPEEFQNLCHKLGREGSPCKVGDFADGCEAYQAKLFGFSPAQRNRETAVELGDIIRQVRNVLPAELAPYPNGIVDSVVKLVAAWEAQKANIQIRSRQRDEAFAELKGVREELAQLRQAQPQTSIRQFQDEFQTG